MTEKAAATEGEPQHRRMLQRVVKPVQRCSVIVSKLAVDVRPLIRSQGDSQLAPASISASYSSSISIRFLRAGPLDAIVEFFKARASEPDAAPYQTQINTPCGKQWKLEQRKRQINSVGISDW